MQIDREEKADQTSQQVKTSTTTEQTDQSPVDGVADSKPVVKPEGRRITALAAPPTSRTRSQSRHSAVTDKGQANGSLENLTKLAPPIPGLANATQIAPERKASAPPSPTSNGFSSPSIVVSDHPQSPATVIPATDGSSTRPTKGGIAYPFSLKVDGVKGHKSNASMMTLDSVGITTPPAVDVAFADKELGAADVEKTERPVVERFFTAGPGAGLFSSGVKPDEVEGAEKVRPGVERFETAQEDLSMLAKAEEKV
jgi:hypothetical protein